MTTREPDAVVVAVILNGTTTRVEDLPLEVIDRIAKQHDVPWLTVVAQPLVDLSVGRDVLAAVALHVGHPMPERLSVRDLMAYFTAVPDDVAVPDGDVVDEDDPDPFGSNGDVSSTTG